MHRIAERSLRMFAVGALLVVPTIGHAHPHVLPTVAAVITFDTNGRLSVIQQTWTYDVAYSTFVARGIDRNKDGTISTDELASLAKEQLDALAEHNYFTTARTPTSNLDFDPIRFYRMEKLDDGRLRLTFTLPIKTKITHGKQFVVEIFDPNFFAYFTMADDGVRLDGPHGGCAHTVAGPQPIDLRNTRSIPSLFWNALDGSKDAGQAFVNRITVTCP